MKADDTDDHKMHAEWGNIDDVTADRLNAARAAGDDGVIRPFTGDTAIFITPGYRFHSYGDGSLLSP